jgi:hypothetical protein
VRPRSGAPQPRRPCARCGSGACCVGTISSSWRSRPKFSTVGRTGPAATMPTDGMTAHSLTSTWS